MIKLKWQNAKRRVNDLIPYDRNPRKLSVEQEKQLEKSLRTMNLVEIPAIDLDNKIISGHQRVYILKKLGRGEEEIDVRIPNRKLTEDEYKRYMISANSISGDWDFELLKDFEPELLLDIGFDENLLANIWDNKINILEEDFDEQKELEKIIKPQTKVGDIVNLGNHKLICGDSNDPQIITKLCDGQKVDMIYSDPPYNINLDYNKGLGGNQNYGADIDDNKTELEYIEFLKTNIKNALSVAKENCHIFYWNTEQQIWIIQTLYKELNIKNKRVCLWIKNGFNPTPQVAFSKAYEPCIYGTVGSPYLSKKQQALSEVFNSDIGNGNNLIDDTNIWTQKRLELSEYKHATSKPPELHHRAILRCTKYDDIILDTFGGSGSTLIACEQLNRRAYLIEKEPIFCDLIISRYEKLTKDKVKIIRNNEEV